MAHHHAIIDRGARSCAAWCVLFGAELLSDVLSEESLISSQLSFPVCQTVMKEAAKEGLDNDPRSAESVGKIAINLRGNIKLPKCLKMVKFNTLRPEEILSSHLF